MQNIFTYWNMRKNTIFDKGFVWPNCTYEDHFLVIWWAPGCMSYPNNIVDDPRCKVGSLITFGM